MSCSVTVGAEPQPSLPVGSCKVSRNVIRLPCFAKSSLRTRCLFSCRTKRLYFGSTSYKIYTRRLWGKNTTDFPRTQTGLYIITKLLVLQIIQTKTDSLGQLLLVVVQELAKHLYPMASDSHAWRKARNVMRLTSKNSQPDRVQTPRGLETRRTDPIPPSEPHPQLPPSHTTPYSQNYNGHQAAYGPQYHPTHPPAGYGSSQGYQDQNQQDHYRPPANPPNSNSYSNPPTGSGPPQFSHGQGQQGHYSPPGRDTNSELYSNHWD